jgi:hypothetical protein
MEQGGLPIDWFPAVFLEELPDVLPLDPHVGLGEQMASEVSHRHGLVDHDHPSWLSWRSSVPAVTIHVQVTAKGRVRPVGNIDAMVAGASIGQQLRRTTRHHPTHGDMQRPSADS